MKIFVFPKRYPQDVYGNKHILERVTFRICMTIGATPQGGPFGFVWKYVYFIKGTHWITIKRRIFCKVITLEFHEHIYFARDANTLEFHANAYILRGSPLDLHANMYIFGKGQPLELHETTYIVPLESS